jgi:hypothetical protein
VNDDCFSVKNCTSKKCTGQGLDQSCGIDADCLKGHFCNGTTCNPQVAKAKKCSKTTECVNSNACYNQTCVEYFSLAADSDLSLTDVENAGSLCQSGLRNNGKCDVTRYGADMKVDTTSGLVKCDLGARCNYMYNDNTTYSEDCTCALNEEGSSWCRLSVSESKFLNKKRHETLHYPLRKY